MTSKIERLLLGVWLHSHEEDTKTETVYRPKGFDFPPSRGRTGFELRPDHTSTYIGISARDGSTSQPSKWQFSDGSKPQVVLTFPDGRRETLQVVSVDKDRLAVRKPAA